MLRLATGLLALLLAASPAAADELGERVRGLYRPYEKEGTDAPDASGVLKAIASKRLRDLIAKDDACAKRTESVCNLGHDPIVNGQDYKIEKVEVAPAVIQGDRATVTARFLNMGGRHETRYDFIQEGGAWKLDDVEALLPRNYRWRLSALLAPKAKRRGR
jgi:hypothetical protein